MRLCKLTFWRQVTKIINQIRPDRQTVLFSATFPKQMEALARKILKKPLEITVGGRSVVAAEIEQIVEVREEETKLKRLLEYLGRYSNDDPEARVLIFVDRQEGADNLLKELHSNHYICSSIHGGKDQVDRDQTIADFKSGVIPVVIATSVAARGLDVKQLKLVVNYDAPNHMEDYVHRAGRTGRAGNKGTCVTFITPDQDRYAVDLLRALTASGATPPEPLKELSDCELPLNVVEVLLIAFVWQRSCSKSRKAKLPLPALASAAKVSTGSTKTVKRHDELSELCMARLRRSAKKPTKRAARLLQHLLIRRSSRSRLEEVRRPILPSEAVSQLSMLILCFLEAEGMLHVEILFQILTLS